jgi:hypothetical protein
VGPVPVVVLAVDAEQVFKVAAAEGQTAVEAFASDRLHPAFGVGVGKRRRLRSMPSLSSNLFG